MILLEVRNLSKAFGGVQAINNVNFEVQQGEILGLIGPNGAGKSTLFDLITGIIKPDNGKILLKGKDITGLLPHKICRNGIARTFQLVKPFYRLSPLENVMVGRLYGNESVQNIREAEVESSRLIDLVGLGNKKVINASMLSLVDRKRLEIARALATKPDLLLLDEMFAGLNPSEIDDAINLVRQIKDSGISLVVIEHVMKVIMGISDRVIVLHIGEKIAEGSSQDIVNDEKVIGAYLGNSPYVRDKEY